MSDSYPGGWFGDSWGAPVNESARHLPTPVGDRCVGCAEYIKIGDQGMLVPIAGLMPAAFGSWHLDCFIKAIIPGGIPSLGDDTDVGRLFVPAGEATWIGEANQTMGR